MGAAGPVPHLPEDGKIASFRPRTAATEVASGVPPIVDVEFAPRRGLFAPPKVRHLPPDPKNPGKPASPDTGSIQRVEGDGTLEPIVTGLDRSASLEFRGSTALVTTLTGKVLQIDGATY
jgi:hypothetical protein